MANACSDDRYYLITRQTHAIRFSRAAARPRGSWVNECRALARRGRFAALRPRFCVRHAEYDHRSAGRTEHRSLVVADANHFEGAVFVLDPPRSSEHSFVAKIGTAAFEPVASLRVRSTGLVERRMIGIGILCPEQIHDVARHVTSIRIGGQVQLIFDPINGVSPFVRSGKLRGLAVTGAGRVASFPALPTVAESGVAGYEVTTWGGLIAPARVPAAIVARLSLEMRTAAASQFVKDSYAPLGAEPRARISRPMAPPAPGRLSGTTC